MLLATVVVAAGLSCGAPQRADLAGCERALREGTVVSSREVGQGIGGAVLVRLRQGDAEVAAVFKSAETIVESDFRFHGEAVATYRDTWKHEVAAYELDRLLALRLVPPTVERKLGGKRGSLQAWAERPLSRFGQGPQPEDPSLPPRPGRGAGAPRPARAPGAAGSLSRERRDPGSPGAAGPAAHPLRRGTGRGPGGRLLRVVRRQPTMPRGRARRRAC